MPGGTFDPLVGKVRPGTYINYESTRHDIVNNNARGITTIPLIGHNYGPSKVFFSLYSSAPDAQFAKLGMSVYDDNDFMLLIREAFKNATQVNVYIAGPDAKATATSGNLTATAKYGGTLGNSMQLVIEANPVGGKDVSVYLSGSRVFYQAAANNVSDLETNDYVDWSGEGEIDTDTAGTNFKGGTNTSVVTKDYTDFLDVIEKSVSNTVCCPFTDETVKTAAKTRVKYLREEVGRGVQFVIPNCPGDYEGIINLTNAVVVDGKELTVAQACAFVAGLSAASDAVTSNTYAAYDGATEIVGEKTNEEAIAALKKGEMFFSKNEAGEIVIEMDINSLVTYGKKKDKTYSKNRVIRTLDSFSESLYLNFPPNTYDNDEDGWDIMEGVGKGILQRFLDLGAITNVDFDNDFKVDRSLSSGDETYFNVGLQPVDSAEKLFFTIKTR